MLNDPLANLFSMILNSELIGKGEITVKPISKLMKQILKVMQDNNYVGEFKETEDSKGNYLKLTLLGHINKCGVIKPRYNVKNIDFEKFEKRFLPAKDVGILLVSTPKGLMTHNEAKSKKTGGKLLAYVY